MTGKGGRPPTVRAGVALPIIFDRWEIAHEGSASAMRNAKSKILRGERGYRTDVEAMVAFDRRAGKHVLLVRLLRPAEQSPQTSPWYGNLSPDFWDYQLEGATGVGD